MPRGPTVPVTPPRTEGPKGSITSPGSYVLSVPLWKSRGAEGTGAHVNHWAIPVGFPIL